MGECCEEGCTNKAEYKDPKRWCKEHWAEWWAAMLNLPVGNVLKNMNLRAQP